MRRMIHTLTALALAVCLLLSLAACGAAGNGAGKYPFKTIRMIVPYGANGTTDLVGRKLGAALGRALGGIPIKDSALAANVSMLVEALDISNSDLARARRLRRHRQPARRLRLARLPGGFGRAAGRLGRPLRGGQPRHAARHGHQRHEL